MVRILYLSDRANLPPSCSVEQSVIHRLITRICHGGKLLAKPSRDELKDLRDEICIVIRDDDTVGTGAGVPHDPEQNIASSERILAILKSMVETISRITREDEVLDRLKFGDMHWLPSIVEREHGRTFGWLLYGSKQELQESITTGCQDESYKTYISEQLDESNSNREQAKSQAHTRHRFLAWLRHGDGICHISGKAGSGKSVLMRYLGDEPRFRDSLEVWAQGKTLVFTRCFFRGSGAPIQRSVEGLCRIILWETLRQCPKLISEVFPPEKAVGTSGFMTNDASAAQAAFKPSALEAAFERLSDEITHLATTSKFCFFIDGLDQFEGDHWKLVKRLATSATSANNIKICVSTRSSNYDFGLCSILPDQRLQLYELTRDEMSRCIEDMFEGGERRQTEKGTTMNPAYSKLTQSIIERADGVFLWARLATGELLRGIDDYLSVAQLRQRLESMPDKPEELLCHMFESCSEAESRQAARSFLLIVGQVSSFGEHVIAHSLVDDISNGTINMERLCLGEIGPCITLEEISLRLSVTTKRLHAQSYGLLETFPRKSPPHLKIGVTFIHSSIADFLGSKHMIKELQRFAGDGFDPSRTLLQGALWLLKSAPRTAISACDAHGQDCNTEALSWFSDRWRLEGIFMLIVSLIAANEFGQPTSPYLAELLAGEEMVHQQASVRASPNIDWYDWGVQSCGESNLRCEISFGANKGERQQAMMGCCGFMGLKDYISFKIPRLRLGGLFSKEDGQRLLLLALLGAVSDSVHRTERGRKLVHYLVVEEGASLNGIAPTDMMLSRDLPTATPWTVFLHAVFKRAGKRRSNRSIRPENSPRGVAFGLMQFCLELGADPGVVFLASSFSSTQETLDAGGVGGDERLWRFDLEDLTLAMDPPNKVAVLMLLQNTTAVRELPARGGDRRGISTGSTGPGPDGQQAESYEDLTVEDLQSLPWEVTSVKSTKVDREEVIPNALEMALSLFFEEPGTVKLRIGGLSDGGCRASCDGL